MNSYLCYKNFYLVNKACLRKIYNHTTKSRSCIVHIDDKMYFRFNFVSVVQFMWKDYMSLNRNLSYKNFYLVNKAYLK